MAKSKLIAGHWIPEVCSKADLSLLLGISIRALGDLHAKGVLVPAAKRGTYQTMPSVKAYIDRLRMVAANRSEDQRNPLNDERIKSEQVGRQIQEIKLAQMRGEVMTLEEVSESWTKFATMMKSSALTIPSKARTMIPHLTAHDAETIKIIVKDMLNDLADEVEGAVIGGEPGDVRPPK